MLPKINLPPCGTIHLPVVKVRVKKRHLVNFGLLSGALLMSFDMVAAYGVHFLSEHVCHLCGVTRAAGSGLAAAIDTIFREV
jgi:hypothetical protein